jgi:rare lipoprotein A
MILHQTRGSPLIRKFLSAISLSLIFSRPVFARCTEATYYDLHGAKTANGEIFNSYGRTAAHPYYRFGTILRVTNQQNGKSVVVRINDRGPNLDLSRGAFAKIERLSRGVASVCYTVQ